MKKLITVIMFAWACQAGWAAIRTESVEYKQGDTTLEGFLAYDTAQPNPRPGVLIVHQWKGITDYEKKRAALIAELGYTVLVADIYGKGVRADNPKDAASAGWKIQIRPRVAAGACAGGARNLAEESARESGEHGRHWLLLRRHDGAGTGAQRR